jgi:hypothetical protein
MQEKQFPKLVCQYNQKVSFTSEVKAGTLPVLLQVSTAKSFEISP